MLMPFALRGSAAVRARRRSGRRPAAGALPLLLLAALAPAGCGADRPDDARDARTGSATPTERPAAAPRRTGARPARRPAVTCAGLGADCAAVAGRVVYVEAVDRDGDGDAHYVLSTRRSITLPGMTAVDVAPALRPRRLARRGEWVSVAGPVQRGSYGQDQIHALRIRHHRSTRPRR